jgi:Na+-driven multidrug efflux pump
MTEQGGRSHALAFWQSCWLAIATGLLLLGLLPLTQPSLQIAGHSPAVAEFEAQYFNTLCGGSPVTLAAVACSCWFGGAAADKGCRHAGQHAGRHLEFRR